MVDDLRGTGLVCAVATSVINGQHVHCLPSVSVTPLFFSTNFSHHCAATWPSIGSQEHVGAEGPEKGKQCQVLGRPSPPPNKTIPANMCYSCHLSGFNSQLPGGAPFFLLYGTAFFFIINSTNQKGRGAKLASQVRKFWSLVPLCQGAILVTCKKEDALFFAERWASETLGRNESRRRRWPC